jgi:hypothetical protein
MGISVPLGEGASYLDFGKFFVKLRAMVYGESDDWYWACDDRALSCAIKCFQILFQKQNIDFSFVLGGGLCRFRGP